MKPGTVPYQQAHFHLCAFREHAELVECTSGPTCTLRFKVACPECLSQLCTGRANERVSPRGYGAQL